MKRILPLVLIATFALVAVPVASANDSREKQMLRRMQQQMQQAEQARALAEQEKAVALADRETLERALEQAQADGRRLARERAARSSAERSLKAAQDELAALATRFSEIEARLAETQAGLLATTQRLEQTESARKRGEARLADTGQDLRQCRTHNVQLYELSRETMARYRDKTCGEALAQAEPFTGLKRVEIENLMESWRDEAERARLPDAAGTAERPEGAVISPR